MAGKTVCYMHGGKSLSGVASPSLKSGRHSKYLPQRLQERYNTSLDDPDILNLTSEIVLLDARLSDLLESGGAGSSIEAWKSLAQSWTAFQIAQEAKDTPRIKTELATIGLTIEAGLSEFASWSEILDILKVREKLVSSERKRLVEMQTMMDSREALMLVHFLADTVKRHVRDVNAVRAISDDLARFVRGGAAERLRATGGDGG